MYRSHAAREHKQLTVEIQGRLVQDGMPLLWKLATSPSSKPLREDAARFLSCHRELQNTGSCKDGQLHFRGCGGLGHIGPGEAQRHNHDSGGPHTSLPGLAVKVAVSLCAHICLRVELKICPITLRG